MPSPPFSLWAGWCLCATVVAAALVGVGRDPRTGVHRASPCPEHTAAGEARVGTPVYSTDFPRSSRIRAGGLGAAPELERGLRGEGTAEGVEHRIRQPGGVVGDGTLGMGGARLGAGNAPLGMGDARVWMRHPWEQSMLPWERVLHAWMKEMPPLDVAAHP